MYFLRNKSRLVGYEDIVMSIFVHSNGKSAFILLEKGNKSIEYKYCFFRSTIKGNFITKKLNTLVLDRKLKILSQN